MMTKPVLVVGATGLVGSAVVDTLVTEGQQVRASTRDVSKHPEKSGVVPVHLDVSEPGTFDAALDGVDAMFVLAPAGHADSFGFLAPFLDRALGRVKKVVVMTASGVEHDDNIPLRRIELKIAASGVKHVILRPSWFAQNFHTYWYQPIKQAGVIPVPAADAKTAFIDARDIGAAAARAIVSDAYDGKAFALTGPEALGYAEAASILSEAGCRTIRYTPIDDATFAANLSGALPPDYIGLLVALFGTVRQGFASHVDPSLRTLLGRAPRTLQDYARDHAALFRA